MNAKRVFLIASLVVVAAALLAYAGDRTRREAASGGQMMLNPQPTVAPATPLPATGEQTEPQLDPQMAAIENEYQSRLEALRQSLALAQSDEERQALQRQAKGLKTECLLAVTQWQLERARARGDARLEAELAQAIARMLNPPAPQRREILRDPKAGISREGGAR